MGVKGAKLDDISVFYTSLRAPVLHMVELQGRLYLVVIPGKKTKTNPKSKLKARGLKASEKMNTAQGCAAQHGDYGYYYCMRVAERVGLFFFFFLRVGLKCSCNYVW